MRFSFYLCLLLPAVAAAGVPALMTDEERVAHERLADPIQVPARIQNLTAQEESARELMLKPIESLEGLDRNTHELIEQKAQDDEKQNSTMKEFLNRSGLPAEQLITAPVAQPNPADAPVKEESPSVEPAKDDKTDDTQRMVINSQDGMYFDSEEGLMVYLRDVRVTDPRFNLRCDNQLKIYLERDKVKAAESEKKNSETEDKARLKTPDTSALNFSGIKSIAASGNVIVTRKGKDGKMMEARAERVTYDGKTGEIILSGGGKQSVQDGENLVEASGPGSYIRMYGNGDIRVVGKRTVTKVKTSDENGKPIKMKKK